MDKYKGWHWPGCSSRVPILDGGPLGRALSCWPELLVTVSSDPPTWGQCAWLGPAWVLGDERIVGTLRTQKAEESQTQWRPRFPRGRQGTLGHRTKRLRDRHPRRGYGTRCWIWRFSRIREQLPGARGGGKEKSEFNTDGRNVSPELQQDLVYRSEVPDSVEQD